MNESQAYYNLKTGRVKFDFEIVEMLINPRTRKNAAHFVPVTDKNVLPRRARRELERRQFKLKYGPSTRF